MTTEAAFLSEIRERPDDDAPRLVFADWVDENGDPERADFIRTQCQMAALPEWDPAAFDLQERAGDLLAEHRPRWLAHLPKWARAEELDFRRGILESATLTASVFLRHGKRLAQLVPLRHLKLSNPGSPGELASFAPLGQMTDLEMDIPGGAAPSSQFFADFHPDRLRRLTVRRSCILRGEPEVVADWPGLTHLSHLSVRMTPDADALVKSPHVGRLECLDLDGELSESAARVLARSESLAGLRQLRLARISPKGIRALGEGDLASLEEFCVWLGQEAGAAVKALLASRWASGLRSLELSGAFGPENWRHFFSSYHPDRLARLAFPASSFPPGGIADLAGADCLAGVTSLQVPYNGFDDGLAKALSRSPKLGRLVRLDLSNSAVTSEGLQAILDSDRLPCLGELLCNHVNIGPNHAVRLAGVPGLSRLRVLEMTSCGLATAGAVALARSPHVRRLVRLNLWNNAIGDAGLEALLQAPWLPHVRELHLNHNGISDRGVTALASCAALARLRLLDLRYNSGITSSGANALAGSSHLTRLLYLGAEGTRCDRESRDRLREKFGSAVAL
jgi:uncharacterized protein (TIGR02996 family)